MIAASSLRAALFGLAGLIAASSGFADTLRQITVPPGDLLIALDTLAKQSDIEIVYRRDQLKGMRTRGVNGNLSTQEAVKRLLEGTTLRVSTDTVTGAMLIAPTSPTAEKSSQTAPTEGLTRVAQASERSSAGQPADANEGPAGGSLEEIVVTAQKREQRLIDVPQSVSVVSAEDLTRLAATQFRDFANTVPGLTFNTTGAGYTQISLRGLSLIFNLGPTVASYLDEVPIGSSSTLTHGYTLGFDAALFDLDRIEVLKGPQGTLYGASSIGGLIKYVAPKPSTTAFAGQARAGVASTEDGGMSYNGSSAINVPLVEGKAALRASGFYSHDGGYIDNLSRGQEDVDRADTYGGRLDLLLNPSDALDVRFTAFSQDIHRDGMSTADFRPTGAPVNGDLEQRRPSGEPFDQRFHLISATIGYDLGWSSITSVTGYQTVRSAFVTDLTARLTPVFALPFFGSRSYSSAATFVHSNTDKFTQELRLASNGERALEWVVGAYYTHESTDTTSEYLLRDLSGAPAVNDLFYFFAPERFEEYAAFGTLTWHVTDRLDLTGGVRQARDNEEIEQFGSGLLGAALPKTDSEDDVTTYLANIRYSFNDRANVYFRYATGYRPGGANYVSVSQSTGAVVVPPNFEADQLKSYEVGFKGQTSDRRFSLDVAAYHSDWNKIILGVTRNTVNYYGNLEGGVIVDGIEMAATARMQQRFAVTGAFAYMDARVDDTNLDLHAVKGERMPNVPRVTAALGADYLLSEAGLRPSIGATLRHVSQRRASFENNPGYPQYLLPSYTSVDFRAGLSFGTVDAQLYVRNAFDERGQLSAFTYNLRPQPAIMQPRTIGLLATMSF